MQASFKKKLPQEGSGKTGKSLLDSSHDVSGSPMYSGGDKNALELINTTTQANLTDSDIQSDKKLMTVTHGDESTDMEFAACSLKRPRNAANDDITPAPKVATTSRGRGRPTASGKLTGLSKTTKQLTAAQKEELYYKTEQEVTLMSQRLLSKETPRIYDGATGDGANQTASALKKKVTDSIEIIRMVSKKSGRLKGTFQRALNDAATQILEVAETLCGRTVAEETAKLQAENARLQTVVACLRSELDEIKAELKACWEKGLPREETSVIAKQAVSQSNALPDEEVLSTNIMRRLGTWMDARFAAYEDRLLPEKRLRPPLAADKAKGKATVPDMPVRIEKESGKVLEPQKVTKVIKGKRKKKKKGKGSENTAAQSAPVQSTSTVPPKSLDEGWSTVVKRGGKKKTESSRNPTVSKGQPRSAKLRSPQSAAVVITIQPEALEKGVTYCDVLAEAKRKVDLAELGIHALRFRRTATGARMLEIPGALSGTKADSLAEKIRESLKTDDIRVTRPTKCAELRISGLDDSVSITEIVTAVARSGDCAEDAVKTSQINWNTAGLGTVWVRCPVTAAKKIADGNRILVGWVAAQVKVLQPRPLRCFRCFEIGHVKERCTSETNRSDQCYRCGQPGHKAGQCSAAPRCTLCAEAGRPEGHRMGSTACQTKTKRSKVAVRTNAPTQPAQPTTNSQARAEMVTMETG